MKQSRKCIPKWEHICNGSVFTNLNNMKQGIPELCSLQFARGFLKILFKFGALILFQLVNPILEIILTTKICLHFFPKASSTNKTTSKTFPNIPQLSANFGLHGVPKYMQYSNYGRTIPRNSKTFSCGG